VHGIIDDVTLPLETAMPLSTTSSARRKTRSAADSRDVVRATLTPESWINAATDVLVDHGIDNVRVDVLASQLGVTRGSFYHHFRDREDLLRRVLQAWRERATEQLTQRLEKSRTNPREQLQDVLSLPFRGQSAERASRIELALRAWARSDAMARQFVDEADASRIGYIAQVFSALGFPIVESRERAFLAYSYLIAESLVSSSSSSTQRRDRSTFAERLLCYEIRA
jgi:AcrR family transcriptional regulator